MDCLRLELHLLTDGSRDLAVAPLIIIGMGGGGASVIFASVRNASEREGKSYKLLVDVQRINFIVARSC